MSMHCQAFCHRIRKREYGPQYQEIYDQPTMKAQCLNLSLVVAVQSLSYLICSMPQTIPCSNNVWL